METRHTSFRKYISNIDTSLDSKKFTNESVAMAYHENSKFTRFELLGQGVKNEIFSRPFVNKHPSQPFKAYPGRKKISIKEYEKDDFDADIFQTISKRRSKGNYQNYLLPLSEIGKLLHFSYGITGKSKMKEDEEFWNFRAVSSAGGLYPLEIYLYANNSEISEGLYHYRPDISSIELIKDSKQMDVIKENIAVQPIDLTKSSCVLFITSVLSRCFIKYSDRAYRFVLQEVGFVSQNMLLICEALDLDSCIVAEYADNRINDLLMIDGTLETIQSVIVIGKS